MRIISVITRLNIGGASPPVIAVTIDLAKRGHDTWLVVGTPEPGEGTLEGEARHAGARVVHVPALRRNPHPVRDVAAIAALVKIFRDVQPDVVSTHMSKAGALGRVAARLARVRVVVHTYHGKGFDVFPRGWRRGTALVLERGLARLASGNVVVSEIQREEFRRLRIADDARLRVIRYGIDLAAFVDTGCQRGRLRGELGLGPEIPFIGVVARLVAIKGQEVLLRAAAQLATEHPTAHFALVGDGEDRKRLEMLASDLSVRERVHFLGWRRDIPAVLADLDVVVLPTVMDFEGTPVALIEALAAGRAVVATNVGSVSEIVRDGKTGLLVPPRDASRLASAIATLLEEPLQRRSMGEAGRELAGRLYGRARMVDETESFFAELLNAARRRR